MTRTPFGKPLRWLCLLFCFAWSAASAAPGGEGEAQRSLLLVAKRGMPDPNFKETVVLVTQHGYGSTVGVVINRRLPLALGELLALPQGKPAPTGDVHYGGPVSPRALVFLFRNVTTPPDSLQVLPGVYMSVNRGLLDDLLQRPLPARDLRIYAGYAGWAPGQLQAEIARGDWHLLEVGASEIFDMDPKLLWQELIGRATARAI